MNDIKSSSGKFVNYNTNFPINSGAKLPNKWNINESVIVNKKSIGVPIENKPQENRVALTPQSVKTLVSKGFKVNVASGAGWGSGFIDDDYFFAGATVYDEIKKVYDNSELIVKVKEPFGEQINMLQDKHILFCYLHLAANSNLSDKLNSIGPNFKAVAFESVIKKDGSMPLLKPMSEIAGKLSVQTGLQYLHVHNGGTGILLGGVTGIERGNVVILGAGTAGYNAATVAAGLDANVTILDINLQKLETAKKIGANVSALMSSSKTIINAINNADLVIGTILIPNSKTPHLVTRSMIRNMKKGSVVVDVSVDQGGCFETTKPTTHCNPTYIEEEIIHYAVTNMPGIVPKTSTLALNNAIFPYVESLAKNNLNYFDKNTNDDLHQELYLAINIGKKHKSTI